MLYAITMITNSIWFEVAAKPSESDSRKRGIFQAKSVRILAKGEIPMCPCVSLFADCMNHSPDALASGLFAYLSNFHAMVASICSLTSKRR